MPEPNLTRSSLNPNYPSNSEKQLDRKPLDAVVKSKIVRKKQSWLSRIKGSIFPDDEQTIGDYIIFDIVVPAVKSLIFDTIVGGLELRLFGERRSRPSNIQRNGSKSYVSYTNYYQGNDAPINRQQITPKAQNRYVFEDVIFTNRGEAENVLSSLCAEIENYGLIDVASFYELCGLQTEFTDHKWGWNNLKDAFTERVRDGYVIKLPKPRPLNS